MIFTAADHNSAELEITASDDWQEMTIAPERLINRFNQKPMSNWSSVGKIHFLPKQGSDLTKVPFSAPRDDTARASFGNGPKSIFLSLLLQACNWLSCMP